MPIHEYECPKCKHKFEVYKHSYKDVRDVEPCPKCKKPSSKKCANRVGLNFVGEGFYVNDYKRKT